MLFRNVLWLHGDEASECSQCSMGDGVQHHAQLIEPMVNMEKQRSVEMEKEDLGPTMYTS